jgi:hypothetical protein|tara:strand:- start:907 stop:1224 length:318 start_codon:yes stop_codon:yes gene_type:complete
MTLSKKEKYLRLNKYTDKKWENEVEKIEDEILKYKVSCILFWDFYQVFGKKSTYLRKMSRLYLPDFHDDFISENDVYKCLLKIGYPMKLAKKRSIFPKIHTHYKK